MRSSHVIWQKRTVALEQRELLLKQKAVCLWFTGLSGSGKSTLAASLESALYKRGHACYLLDGDNIRHGLNGDLGFSPDDRKENIRRIGETAALFTDAGLITLTAFISPFRADRESVREKIGSQRFIEIHVDCPLQECERRDVKGLYQKARKQEIKDFTGISSPYQAPDSPEIRVDTEKDSLNTCLTQIMNYLEEKDILGEK